MKNRPLSLPLLLVLALLATAPGRTATAAEMAYDEHLLRLAEVLGSLHYLRPLCGERDSPWRNRMEDLLEAEQPDPERRARLIASFNHGYSTFASVYKACTKSAVAAIERYMKEGEKLTTGIVDRYGY
mgnify:CR=1 FL=1